ncbi:heat shock 22 kDa protein, mitochondrial [Coffea arabica]|uniref:Heat shock 22 kDa protein, mitochondrial n=1 Tax=Coffea arabica TaxID=13443 RepID=A0A6P6TQ58_COFAR
MFSDPVLPAALILSLLVATHCKQIRSYNKKPSSSLSSSSSMASLTTLPTATSFFFKKQLVTELPPPSKLPSLISSTSFTALTPLSAKSEATGTILSQESESDSGSDFEAETLASCFDNISNPSTLPYANPFLKAGNRNILELQSDEEAARIRVDMPGVEKDGVKIWFENGDLKIEGVEVAAGVGTDGGMDEEARKYAITVKIFEPEMLKKDEATAVMKNGVLKMVIPKLKFEERKDILHINAA